MGKKSPRLNDFRSGEMTPGLGARSDLAAYSKGCILMKNCMPLVEGGVERVPGTRFLRTVKQTEEGWGLRITRSGSGSGDVDSNPLGIDCGPTCYTFFADGASINLTAEADVGSAFEGWSGDGTGTPIRTVVMNGNKVVNAEFAFVGFDFRICDMRIDGDDIFVCGTKSVAGNWAAVVAKFNRTSGTLVDYGEFYPFPGWAYYLGLEVDETDVYLAGSCLQSSGGRQRAIIHKRSRTNLSPVAWTWTWAAVNGGWLETRDVCIDDSFVYGTISYAGGYLVGRCKVAKSNGAKQWALYGRPTSPGGILNVGNYVYILKHSGGYYCIEKVNKTTGTIVEITYVSGAFNRGMTDGEFLWLGGERHPYYWYKTATKIRISDMSEVWRYEGLGGVSCWRAIADADGVYMIGRDDGYSSTPYYQKIAADGSGLIWLVQDSLNINKRIYYALCQTVDLLYIGTFDQVTNKGFIEKRSKIDGSLISW